MYLTRRENGFRFQRRIPPKKLQNNLILNMRYRNFAVDGPKQKQIVAISYVQARERQLYWVAGLDLHSRLVITCAISNRMKKDLAICASKMTITLRRQTKGCVYHTDRGSQYCSHDYQKLLSQHGFQVSVIGKGNCYDKVAMETFFKTIKVELIWRYSWQTRRATEIGIFKYINHCLTGDVCIAKKWLL